MYIKSIVLDGFKSYAQRTEITGFDRLFNAITGLNGSGKSNILDSICFVLGITNLHHVRASNLQELVYKNGQAGVTKATVSITFDNSDPEQSPFGYAQYDEIVVTRQVVVGGRNKYMINGTAASNQKVADLFKSVSLNINNPHFLIMQGRVTKVLNMKPAEILSMVEEAAGTSLYESKRENAEKVIEKKEGKLREIDALIQEETAPKLERLKKERDSYVEYQKTIREIEHLTKLHIAWQYVSAERDSRSSRDEMKVIEDKVTALQDRCTEINSIVTELDGQIEELDKQIQGDKQEVLDKLERELHDKQQSNAVANSNYDQSVKEVKSQQKKMKELTKHLNDDSRLLTSKEQELNRIMNADSDMIQRREEARAALESAQKRFQTESAGLASNEDGEDATLNDQLFAAKNEISEASTAVSNAELTIKHSQDELKKRKAAMTKASSDYDKDKSNLDNMLKQVAELEKQKEKANYNPEEHSKMKEEQKQLQQQLDQLNDTYRQLCDRFPSLSFDYVEPQVKGGFDRNKVRGPVARLLKVKDLATTRALEVVAGSRLYHIVVDNDTIAQQLLEKGQLRRKYTFLPLNKLNATPLDDKLVRRAQQLVGRDNVDPALDLVEYDDHVKAAMAHTFGGAFVCKNTESARTVTFDKQIMKKSVTLEGDSFDPAGTLSGGSRAQSASVLTALSKISDTDSEMKEKSFKLADLNKHLTRLNKACEEDRQITQKLSLKRREMELIQDRLKKTAYGAQLEHISKLEEVIQQQKQVIEDSKSHITANKKKVADLEYQIKNAKQLREKRMRELEKELSKCKKTVEELDKAFSKREQQSDTLKLEVEGLRTDVETLKQQLETAQTALSDQEAKTAELKSSLADSKSVMDELNKQLKSHKSQLAAWSKEISSKVSEQKKLKQEYLDSQLKIEQLGHDREAVKTSGKSALKQLESLIQKHDWITEEKQYFGQADSAYDFKANDPKETSRRINKLQEQKNNLERTVNMRAMSMLEQAQSQHNDMLRKRRILVKDKEKMAAIIAELNEKKNRAVEKAYKQVNSDFTSIFSMLLPGATAKLSPVGSVTSCLEGLEVKVGFGDVWKESLTELSGGQRSLVALSLILSMLLFKPAPLYILDEIDAALDLSHTQNIGHMLRTHFRHSQFIVVSLKDGMFTNANVLFRTRFVDGVSMVVRYTQNPDKRPPLTDKNGQSTSKDSSGKDNKKSSETTSAVAVQSKRPRVKS